MPTLFIIIPFIGIVLLNILYSTKVKQIAFHISCAIAIIQIILSSAILFEISKSLLSRIEINYFVNFSIDFYGALVLFTIGLISLIALLVRKYSSSEEFFNFSQLILIIIIGMNGTVMVTDIFSLYVFLEVTGVTSFILTGIGILYMTFGSLSYNTLSLSLANMSTVPPQLLITFILLIAGFSIKSGMVPFHMWVPDAYTNAGPAVSVLLAGIVTKAGGIYAMIRLLHDVFINIAIIQEVLAFLAIITIVSGALLAIGQSDFKKILAYSSISQIGYIIIGAACGTPLGFIGAFMHFFNHATFKSLLFVNSAAVEMQTGTRDINKLQGLATKMKITGGTSVVGFLSAAGIPPLAGFWSKLVVIVALWQVGFRAYAIIALLASILTLAYFLILQRKVFFGKTSPELENIKEANAGISISAILLALIIILMGVGFPVVLYFFKLKGLF